MAIPAGNVDGIKARHLLGFDDDILENLVDRVADVNGGVRVWRAVVQNKFRAASGLRANFFV